MHGLPKHLVHRPRIVRHGCGRKHDRITPLEGTARAPRGAEDYF